MTSKIQNALWDELRMRTRTCMQDALGPSVREELIADLDDAVDRAINADPLVFAYMAERVGGGRG